jgi:hypothetical protein
MRPSNVNDLRWTWDGDISINTMGDLEDTSTTNLGSFLQEVHTRIKSVLYDWALHPYIGSSISEIIGEPNNRETAEDGKTRIIMSLTKDGFCEQERIRVRYMPISQNMILFNVLINVPNSSNNDILNLTLTFNINDFEIVFL